MDHCASPSLWNFEVVDQEPSQPAEEEPEPKAFWLGVNTYVPLVVGPCLALGGTGPPAGLDVVLEFQFVGRSSWGHSGGGSLPSLQNLPSPSWLFSCPRNRAGAEKSRSGLQIQRHGYKDLARLGVAGTRPSTSHLLHPICCESRWTELRILPALRRPWRATPLALGLCGAQTSVERGGASSAETEWRAGWAAGLPSRGLGLLPIADLLQMPIKP